MIARSVVAISSGRFAHLEPYSFAVGLKQPTSDHIKRVTNRSPLAHSTSFHPGEIL